MLVGRRVLANIHTAKQTGDLSNRIDVFLDGAQPDPLGIDTVAHRQVNGKEGQLLLGPLLIDVLHEIVMVLGMPTHYISEYEPVDPTGTNCPKFFGILGGSRQEEV